MGLPVEINNLMMGAVGGYQVGRSLRFRSSASAYLNRTPASAGNRQILTWSGWIKRGSLGSVQNIFIAGSNVGGQQSTQLSFDSSEIIYVYSAVAGSAADISLNTTQVFRDPSAWYHIVLAIDTTQATSSNRVKLYVNGVQVTAFSTATYPALNHSTAYNNTVLHTIGRFSNVSANPFDGYMAEINFIDGQQLTPSSFGAYDNNGVWQPIKYGGTYGTNGFYLPFSDTSSTTNLVKDSSGNGNNWTPNNISLTAGTTYDSMLDVPTNNSPTAGNFCVFNPLSATGGVTLSNGNLDFSGGASSLARGTVGTGNRKYYWEIVNGTNVTPSTPIIFGIANISGIPTGHDNWLQAAYFYTDSSAFSTLNRFQNGSSVQSITVPSSLRSLVSGNILQIAYDGQSGKVWLGVNNTWADGSGGTTGDPSSGTNQTFTLADTSISMTPLKEHAGVAWSGSLNCGQRPFSYTPPTGFVALNTYNLPPPTIPNGAKYMQATLYTGNGSSTQTISQSVTGNSATFFPDFVWTKGRSAATNNIQIDSVRGGANYLISDSTSAEVYNSAAAIQSFSSNGYVIGNGGAVNTNAATYVAWQWNAGSGVTSTNTSGSITSTVSVNQTAGFSVVTYTGTGSAATVGHGLGVAPSMIIVKSRNTVIDWIVYHTSTGNNAFTTLDTTAAQVTGASYMWNSTSPTSSVFSVNTDAGANGSTKTYVAYCFAAISSYSAFGSYTGNGSSDGPFVFTNFRPRWIMIKRTDSTQNWPIIDTSRDTYNIANKRLFANLSDAEDTGIPNFIDVLSNGFKCRDSNISYNASGGTYIYAAFAESPFQISRAR